MLILGILTKLADHFEQSADNIEYNVTQMHWVDPREIVFQKGRASGLREAVKYLRMVGR
jgi:hypothetical protein